MKPYLLIPLLAISCHYKPSVIPKAGEVWRIDHPFKATVKIDSIDQFNCVRFSWEDSTGKHIGVCDTKYFHGEVKPISWNPHISLEGTNVTLSGRVLDSMIIDPCPNPPGSFTVKIGKIKSGGGSGITTLSGDIPGCIGFDPYPYSFHIPHFW